MKPQIENARLKKNELLKMELSAKKCKSWKGGSLRQFRQEQQYGGALRCGRRGFPGPACRALHISRLLPVVRLGKAGASLKNQRIAQLVQRSTMSPDKATAAFRTIWTSITIRRVNDKRTLRICRCLGIQSCGKTCPTCAVFSGGIPHRQLAECTEPPILRRPPQRSGSPM